ncbi:MAG: helix-turn-helix transcriptional regulator [Enhygromyxa sp.]
MIDRHIALVEAGYELESSGPEWLAELSGPMRALHDCAVSAFLFEFDRHEGQPVLCNHHTEDPKVAEGLQRTFAEVPAALLDMFFTVPLLAAPSSEILAAKGIDLSTTPLRPVFEESGFMDVFAMSAFDPLGSGVSIGVGLGRPIEATDGQRRSWSQIAAHLAAGHRLRRRLAGSPAVSQAGAVLRTDGKVEHSEPGVDDDLRALLREAVERVERARARRRDAEEALQLWQSLVAGEWSLADHFEGNGRRFYVAVRNPPNVAQSKALTRREAEVVSYLACGTKTSAAAYALGLDEVTVRGYLRTALVKLGMRSRAELIALRSMLHARRQIEPQGE